MYPKCSCVPKNSAGRRRRASNPSEVTQADYQVGLDLSERDLSSITGLTQTANEQVATTGVVINGVRSTGTAETVVVVPGITNIPNFRFYFCNHIKNCFVTK